MIPEQKATASLYARLLAISREVREPAEINANGEAPVRDLASFAESERTIDTRTCQAPIRAVADAVAGFWKCPPAAASKLSGWQRIAFTRGPR